MERELHELRSMVESVLPESLQIEGQQRRCLPNRPIRTARCGNEIFCRDRWARDSARLYGEITPVRAGGSQLHVRPGRWLASVRCGQST